MHNLLDAAVDEIRLIIYWYKILTAFPKSESVRTLLNFIESLVPQNKGNICKLFSSDIELYLYIHRQSAEEYWRLF